MRIRSTVIALIAIILGWLLYRLLTSNWLPIGDYRTLQLRVADGLESETDQPNDGFEMFHKERSLAGRNRLLVNLPGGRQPNGLGGARPSEGQKSAAP